MEYTFNEYTDMHLMYGLASSNALAARRLYAQRFPNRRIPNRKTFERIDRRLRETGTFKPNNINRGAQRTVRTVELEENVLNAIAEDASTSVRKLSAQFNSSTSTVWKILHEQSLHPYHIQKVHAMNSDDYLARMQYSNWLLQKHQENQVFVGSILYTDEAGFTKNGIINFHNTHVWNDENPHAVVETRHQRQFHINVWAGIIGQYLVGPFVLPERLNRITYLEFLQNNLPELLENIPLETRRNMWFMHDGAPPHFSVIVREHLDNVYANQWIGRGGPVSWPPRSPDLNPLDFYLWSHLKHLVYAIPIDTREQLLERIMHYCGQIRDDPRILWRVQQSSIRRARECIRVGGGHFENLL